MNARFKKQNTKWLVMALFLVLDFTFYISVTRAQVVAIGVEQKMWRIDDNTAHAGITLQNGGGQIKVAIPKDTVSSGTKVELTVYASDYFIKNGGAQRITPMYRVVIEPPAGLASSFSQNRTFPIEVQYHPDNLGRKILAVLGDDDIWREIEASHLGLKNALRATISEGTTYLAVFADDKVLEDGFASWYKYKNCLCAASPDYPKGTMLKVANLENGKSVAVRVNDFGPEREKHPDRVIDLDKEAFKQIGNIRKGLIRVRVEKLP